MALDTVLAPIICKAGCLHRAPSNAHKSRRGSPSVPIHAWHPHKQHCKTPTTFPMLCSTLQTLLGIFKSSVFNPKTSQILLCPAKLCGIYRIRASSNARETGQMSLHRRISLLLTFTLPLPFTNSAGREREQRFKERQYRNIFKSPFITCILWD